MSADLSGSGRDIKDNYVPHSSTELDIDHHSHQDVRKINQNYGLHNCHGVVCKNKGSFSKKAADMTLQNFIQVNKKI